MAFRVSCDAFGPNQNIPGRYTCDGQNLTPPLAWRDVPVGTKSLALILDDPDAPNGTYTHWVVFNIPGDADKLPELVPTPGQMPMGIRRGKNSAGTVEYSGPCPPEGSTPHHYHFHLYALDTTLSVPDGASRQDVERAMQGHILDQSDYVGLYQRLGTVAGSPPAVR